MQAEKLTNEKWLNLYRRGNWVFASRHDPNQPPVVSAVTIAPYIRTPEENKIVVIKEFRTPLNDYEYSFPAGLLEPGESVEDAARRELKEETGLDLTQISVQSPALYSSAGMTDESSIILFVECEGKVSKAGLQNEDIECFLWGNAEVEDILRNPGDRKLSVKLWLILTMLAAAGGL